MSYRTAATFATKQALEIAKEIPVVGQCIAPLYTIFVKVLAVCEEVQGCKDAIGCVENRILEIQKVILAEPDGLALVVQKRPELSGKLTDSVNVLLVKYDETCKVLEPLSKKKTFFKLFLSNAAKIKESLESLDAEIVAELKNLSFSLQVTSFNLQTRTYDIVTDLQDKITNLYGGQEGLLANEAALQEVSQTIGMEVSDLRSSILDYLTEMQQAVLTHSTEQANRVIAFQSAQMTDLKHYIQRILAASVPAGSIAAAPAPSSLADDLAEVTLSDSLVVDEQDELGEGQFGCVLRGHYQGRDVAVKVIKVSVLKKLGSAAVQDLKKEILIHHRLSVVPGVVKLIGVDLTDTDKPKAVLELAEGSLHDALYHSAESPAFRHVVKDLTWRLDIIRQICQAVCYMHHIDFLHRDIKPLNVLLFPSDTLLPDGTKRHGAVAKLADFGFARGVDNHSVGLLQPKGTPYYMAPEVFKAQYSKESDMYALAVLMNEVLSESEPYRDQDARAHLDNLQLSYAVSEGARPTLFRDAKSDVARQLVLLSITGSDEYGDLISELSRVIVMTWSKQPETRGSVDNLYRVVNKLLDLHQYVCKYGRSKKPSSDAPTTANSVVDMLSPHMLVKREVRDIDELVGFLRSCKLMPKFAQQYAKSLVTAKGIFSVNMLANLVKLEGFNSLTDVVTNETHTKSIALAVANIKETPTKALGVLEEDEQAVVDGLAKRLELGADGDDDVADLISLYSDMAFSAPMLSCIAVCFCEQIANSFGSVNKEHVIEELAAGGHCFDLDDAIRHMTKSGQLSPSAVAEAWQSFMCQKCPQHATAEASRKPSPTVSNKPSSIKVAPQVTESKATSVPVSASPSAAPASGGYVFSNDSLAGAVDMWCKPHTKDLALREYGHISTWNTSLVTSMKALFKNRKEFNDNISQWDVSKVTDMQEMFAEANVFDQPIGGWNVSRVTGMNSMFCGANYFNQPIGGWNVSRVTDMGHMFYGYESSFNQPIGDWDVSSVTNMSCMFCGARRFNQPITNWNVSRVHSMGYMFNNASSFNQPIGGWDVSRVTTMDSMFLNADAFNQSVATWDVSNVTDMKNMFDKGYTQKKPKKKGLFGKSLW